MRTIEPIADVDEEHRLRASVPADLPEGPVRVIVLVPEADDAGASWSQSMAREWAEELADPRQDIYTLEDGQPTDAPR